MIVWIVTKLVCLLYNVEIHPNAKAFCVCVSWIEMLLVAITFFKWLIKRVSRVDCAVDDRQINNGNCSEAEEGAEYFLQKVKNFLTTREYEQMR